MCAFVIYKCVNCYRTFHLQLKVALQKPSGAFASAVFYTSTVAFDEAWLFSSFRPSQKNFFFIAKKGKSGQGIITFMSLFS